MNDRAARLLRRLACALLLLVLAYLVVAGLAGRDAAQAVQRVAVAQQALRGVLHGETLTTLNREQVAQASRELASAADRLARDQSVLTPLMPLAHAAGWLPGIGTPVSEAPELLALAVDVAAGGADLARGVDPLLAEAGEPTPAGIAAAAGTEAPAARLVDALTAAAPALARGDRLLNEAARRRVQLHPARYQGLFGPLRRRLQQLDTDLPAALQHADALALLPNAARALLGFDGPRTYVVLGQDSAELRPTGGFIGSAGVVTVDQGRLVYQEYRSSSDFDNPNVPPLPPPVPLVRYLGAGAWVLRDANWSPDFPTVARQVEQFISRDLGVPVDGVLAFDNAAVTDLLQALGPLAVPGFREPVTATTWFDVATRTIFTGPGALLSQLQDYQQAKGAGLSAVLQAVLARAQSARGRDLLSVVDGLRSAALGNHLLLALDDQRPAAWAHLVGTDGSLFPAPNGDVVAPVEANLSYSKVESYVVRRLEYEVWLDATGRRLRAQLTLSVRNTLDAGTLADPSKRIEGGRWQPDAGKVVSAPGLYLDYMRLYLPADAPPNAVAGLDEPSLGTEGGYTVLAGVLAVGPQAEGTVSLTLPQAHVPTSGGAYTITLIKQPGVEQLPVQVTVHLAAGTRVTMLPPDAQRRGDAVVVERTLTAAHSLLAFAVGSGS